VSGGASSTSIFERIGTEVGRLVASKNLAYGGSFARSGEILVILYPDGIAPEKYTDALAVTLVLDKLFRIAAQKDAFGESPWRDVAGYGILGVAASMKGGGALTCTPSETPEIPSETLSPVVSPLSSSLSAPPAVVDLPSPAPAAPPSPTPAPSTLAALAPPAPRVCSGPGCDAALRSDNHSGMCRKCNNYAGKVAKREEHRRAFLAAPGRCETCKVERTLDVVGRVPPEGRCWTCVRRSGANQRESNKSASADSATEGESRGGSGARRRRSA
jgi:hypothetical protein